MTGVVTTAAPKPHRFWRNALAAALGLLMLALFAAPSAAVEGDGLCSRFGQGQIDGWGPCPTHPNIGVTTDNAGSIGGASDWYLKLTDQSGPSAACSSDRKYIGDWLKKLSGCGQFCYDVRIFEIPLAPLTVIYPAITIYGPPGSSATFTPSIPATTDAGAYPGWHHICAPIRDGAAPPSGSDGAWTVTGGTWNSIITNVSSVLLRVDFTSQPSEVVGYDNICLTPGNCGSSVKVCKIGGAGIAPGTPFTFTVGGQTITVPAGPAPTGTCVDVNDPSMKPGSTVSIAETIPSGDAITNITVNPASSIVGAPDLGAGTVSVRLDKESTEVDYTNIRVPPPEPSGCYKGAKVNVKCNADGTYTVTLSGVGGPGDIVTLSSSTAGVVVSPPQQPWAATTSWTISGAAAGQTIVLSATDTKVGGGEKPGMDQCCSGEIKIVVPACPHKTGEIVVEKKVVNKTRASNAVINALTFPASLTCSAPANRNVSFGLQNATSHTETGVAYGSTCSAAEATSALPPPPADVCGQGSVAVWATPVITPASAVVNAPVTTFTVVNELDCKEADSKIDLGIEKTGGTTPAQQPFYSFDLKVTNVGGPISNASAVIVTETVPPNMIFNTIGGAGWTCTPLGGPAGTVITCVYSGPPIPSGQVLAPIHIDATSTAGAPYPPVTNCAIVGVTAASGYVDTNASNDKACVTVTKPNACPAPMVPGPVQGQCVCPAPAAIGAIPNVCMCPNGQPMTAASVCTGPPPPPPPVCKPPLIPNAVGVCGCPSGTTLRDGICVRRQACRAPMQQNADGGCSCPAGLIQRGQRCLKPLACTPPLIPNAAGTACVCAAGTVRRGRACITPPPPPVCDPPARLRGGVCRCPPNMQPSGRSCIPRERRPPRDEGEHRRDRPEINPGDVLRVLPHVFPNGGGERGGSTDPRGGGKPSR